MVAADGYHATTMADIAAAAGVTKPVLYQHFASKHDLYENLLQDIGSELQSRVVGAAAATTSPRERVTAGITAFVDYVEEERDGFTIFFSGINRTDDVWAVIMRDVEESLCNAIVALIDVATLPIERRRVVARGIIGLAEATVRYTWFDQDLPIAKATLTNDIINMVWGGVRSIGTDQEALDDEQRTSA